MKYLVSKNFKDMEEMKKPAFGMPPINYPPTDKKSVL